MGQGEFLALVQADLRAGIQLIGLLVSALDADIQVAVEGAEPGDHAEELQFTTGFAIIVKIQVMGFLDDRVGDDHVVLNKCHALPFQQVQEVLDHLPCPLCS